MQKSDSTKIAKTTHRKVQASTTLNRKYVKRPVKSTDVMVPVKRSGQIKHFSSSPRLMVNQKTKEVLEAPKMHPIQKTANQKMQVRQVSSQPVQQSKVSARELKDRAIKKALAEANAPLKEETKSNFKKAVNDNSKMHFGFGRVALALSCAAVAVFAIVYFVNLNMPDISLRVAAMQTGIDASYPGYVPRGYNVSSITSEEGKVSIVFNNSAENSTFTLTEEKSSWDSSALLSNFVKDAYEDNYTVIREQGLTIYVSGSNASWVNGGVFYRIDTTSGSLTNKQIRSIAVSL